MTEISRFWTGRTSQGSPGDAGSYSSAQFSEFVARILDGAEKANRGVIRGVESELEVTPNSPAAKEVLVESGAAVVQGRWYHNDDIETLTIATNVSGSTRLDIIVLRADYAAQTVRLAVVQGTPGAGMPAITQNADILWEIPLAYITLASGYSTVTASMITDWREYANIPSAIGLDTQNGDSVTLEVGTVVIDAGGSQIQRSTAVTSAVMGIIERRTLADENGRILISGIVPVLCNETVSTGEGLVPSATAGQAMSGYGHNQFGWVIVGNTGAGTTCLAFIQCFPRIIPAVRAYRSTNQSINNGTPTAIALNQERFDTDSMHTTGGSNTRLTCNSPGIYQITGHVDFESGGGTREIAIILNGVTTIARNTVPTVTGVWTLSISTPYRLAAGDYVELFATQSSGGALNVVSAGNYSPEFSMVMVGV